MDSVYLPVMDVDGSLSDLLLPGIKAQQVALIVPHKPAAICTQALNHHNHSQKLW